MQTANILVALGGDLNNTVPKYGVTASEIAMLQAIHGNDAVSEVEPLGDVDVRPRDELERLRGLYGRAMGSDGKPIIDAIYPGRAAQVFDNLDELGLSPEQFKVSGRVEAPTPAKKPRRSAPKGAATADADAGENADAVFE